MAMLMTPERSPTSPQSAPKISGTDRARAPVSMVVSGMTAPLPDPAHSRKASTKVTPKRMGTNSCVLCRAAARLKA